jgi:adenylate cyclase
MRITRTGIHLTAGLTMLTYIVGHLLNHAFAVVSIDAANAARTVFVSPWTNPIGTSVLTVAVLTHISLALWTTYIRRSLRMPVWQWTQLVLGLSIPYLLIEHALLTGGGILRGEITPNYGYVLAVFWHFAPLKGWFQLVLLVVAWSHASIGLHHWLKVRPWYPSWRPHLYAIAVVLPVMAILGYIAGGFEVLEKLKDPFWLIKMLKAIGYPGPAFDQRTEELRNYWLIGYSAVIGLTLLARQGRIAMAAPQTGGTCDLPKWAPRFGAPWRDAFGNEPGRRHSPCFGLWWTRALFDLPRFDLR